ncbi:MAG: hypothetical protein F6K28_32780 [Microcoleus sp. SIO2G3]|nr:hypothetical protein [Microcoleus sp. SIO2G3]
MLFGLLVLQNGIAQLQQMAIAKCSFPSLKCWRLTIKLVAFLIPNLCPTRHIQTDDHFALTDKLQF